MIMKKILLGFIMLVTTATMSAQIELEFTFEGAIADFYVSERETSCLGTDDLIFLRGVDEKLHVYNLDYSLYGIFEIADKVTRNIFTTDNKLCFIEAITEGDYPNYKSKIIVVDENKKIVKEIQLDGFTEGDFYPIKIGNEYKLVIQEYLPNIDPETGNYLSTSYKTYIYSCPGNGETTTSVENVPAKVKRNAYPNPANDLVTLPYDANGATSMKIYDMQGKLVERKFLDKNKQELQLNVKDYPSGMYLFEVNGESNSFIVE